ncbi:MAG: hypothetical protein K9M02_16980 [Thiohalocapsa sp.]|nr:hypothetical protein [Thiohalocapsa sp.]
MTDALRTKLHPSRFPKMTPQLGAVMGFLLGEALTEPAISALSVTPDGHVIALPVGADGIEHAIYIGSVADLRANLRRLGMAAGLDDAQWAAFEGLVRERVGIALGGLEQS